MKLNHHPLIGLSQNHQSCIWINVVVVSELRIIFSLFDKDHDNNISMDEVMQVMQAMGQQPDIDRLRETFQLVDLDGKWSLTFAWDSGMHTS